jgi:hypothetical protein
MIIQVLYGNDMDPMNRSFDKCPGNVQSNQLTTKRVTKIPPDSNTGFLLGVDLEYEDFLHNEHNDYPLPPKSLTITDSMLSPFARNLGGIFVTSNVSISLSANH